MIPCRGACGALLPKPGLCQACSSKRHQQINRRRDKQSQALYGSRWRTETRLFLRAHPLCQCEDCGEGSKPGALPATVVDHIKPHGGDARLFWSPENWQAMAKRCHDRKTAREDGGFGNPKRKEGEA